jgi:hypothetical protein
MSIIVLSIRTTMMEAGQNLEDIHQRRPAKKPKGGGLNRYSEHIFQRDVGDGYIIMKTIFSIEAFVGITTSSKVNSKCMTFL